MTVLFECTYRGQRHLGFGVPDEDGPLRMRRLTGEVRHRVAVDGDDVASWLDSVTTGGEVVVTPRERAEVRFRPPLLPGNAGEAMVSGFMRTHNVKAEENPPEQPNWFLKGLGEVLKTSGQRLSVPEGAHAVCEEAEVVLVYVVDERGEPRYAGYTFGNDVTDIGRFKHHAGHLSYAKLCDAAVVPFLFRGAPPRSVTGSVSVERYGTQVWQGEFTTGTRALYYGVEEMMGGLFAHRALLHPGRVHYVFLGADHSSYHGGFRMADGDRVRIDFSGEGVTLTNEISWGER
ncbi:FAH family protein [Actinopolyspora erythraea]|uniref:FAH family protein n=1 Tax=Actinopolyspora erythraea TaxID=414996 RepID=A0A099D6F7_9ACTN|nr:fumarylacetoacetate hydrolase [Actinopolyspora erythraea]ASU78663.1 FAH family protein [Actinopolyspora erythraea]KGI81422.1 FAH family protein [Actinopolyspora erythraea]